MVQRSYAVLFAVLLSTVTVVHCVKRFTIENDRFMRDDAPIQLISGSIHYYRIHPAYWYDRLVRAKALGLNTVQFYVPWNLHEPSPGVYNWEGFADVERWLTVLHELGFLVLLRPGPYICAEWDFGGLPWWLASTKVRGGRHMLLRSDDPDYLYHVENWWKVLFGKMRPFLYENAGPIVMVQVENEYGFCGPSRGAARSAHYLRELLRMAREGLGNSVILYTTDPPKVAEAGTLKGDEVFTAVDFGGGWYKLEEAFGVQASLNPPGKSAPICTEYYTGWLTKWGEKMAITSAQPMVDWFKKILQYANNSGSVNFYMAHGGTNFGFWPGAGYGGDGYHPDITSYDYDCMISEAGDYGQPGLGGPSKFHMVREAIIEHTGTDLPPIPPPPSVQAYGSVLLTPVSSLLSSLHLLADDAVEVQQPDIMEEYGQRWGVIVYSTKVDSSLMVDNAELAVHVHDYGKVVVDGIVVASIDRNAGAHVTLPPCHPTADGDELITLEVLVFAMGRDNFACDFDVKGIVNPEVTLNGQVLTGWKVVPMVLDSISRLTAGPQTQQQHRSGNVSSPSLEASSGPTFYSAKFSIPEGTLQPDSTAGKLPSTFLSTVGWSRGLVWVNGFNLGWYWTAAGPQNTLYVPGAILSEGTNDITVLEMDGAPDVLQVEFVATPDFSGPPGTKLQRRNPHHNIFHSTPHQPLHGFKASSEEATAQLA